MSERADCLQNYRLTGIVLWIISFATSAKGITSAIHLDVSHTNDPTTLPGLLVVNCSVDANLTDMVTVASLTVFGSKPYGNQGEFDELAVVDIWSQTPKLASVLDDADAVISGKTGSGNDGHSYLTMSWNSPTLGYRQYYKSVGNGLDHQGQAASISTTVKVEFLNAGSCGKIESIDSQLREVSEKVDKTCTAHAKTAAALSTQVQKLHSEIEVLGSKLETFHQNQNLHFKMMAIDKGSFDVSDISKGRVYLASKTKAAFNIGAANQACKSSGGYLVEFDDDEEYQFVYDFVTLTGGADSFFIGGNDIESEGQFVYYNSKKAVPTLSGWSPGQPNNYGGSEDCVEIKLTSGGLIDSPCSETGKYVCELNIFD